MKDLLMDQVAKIKVIGLGGGGGNAINRMVESGVKGVEFIAANTDLQVLNTSIYGNNIEDFISKKLTKQVLVFSTYTASLNFASSKTQFFYA